MHSSSRSININTNGCVMVIGQTESRLMDLVRPIVMQRLDKFMSLREMDTFSSVLGGIVLSGFEFYIKVISLWA